MSQSSTDAMLKALLEQHVSHELKAFDEASFQSWVAEYVDELWPHLGKITLRAMVPEKNVMAAIRTNVVAREIPGAVAEIAGECASELFGAPFHLNTRVEEVISSRQIEEFVDKAVELKSHRDALLEKILQQPIYSEMISDVIYQGVVRYIYEENLLSKKVPGVSSILKLGTRMVNKTVPNWEGVVEESVKGYVSSNISNLIKHSQTFLKDAIDGDQLREWVMDFWSGIESQSLGDLQDGIDQLDLTEFVVLGYEFWRSFRETPYFMDCCTHVVDQIYAKYGDEPVSTILSDFGSSPQIVLEQVMIFAPEILEALKGSGFVEHIIRKRLEGFYFSDSAKQAVASFKKP